MPEEVTIDQQDAAPAATSWRDSLPGELKSDPILSRYQSIEDLAKGHVEVERQFRSRAAVPKADADEGEWSEFYDKLGRPKDTSGYTIPDSDEAFTAMLGGLTDVAHKAGITQTQWDSLISHANSFQGEKRQELEGMIKQASETWLQDAKQKYGGKFDQMHATATRFFDRLTEDNPEIGGVLKATGLGNHPAILDLVMRVADVAGNDAIPSGLGGTETADTYQSLVDETEKIVMSEEYRNKRHPDHKLFLRKYIANEKTLVEAGFQGFMDPRLRKPV